MLSYKFRSPHYRALMQHTACILFTPNGVIKEASPLFLDTVGYTLDEIEGEHHRLFCFPEETSRPEYTAFWQTLAAGYSQQGRFRRLNSDGKEIWLEATYIPIKNSRGKVTQIFKVASDVTAKHQNAARERAILQALDSSMAVIEFTPDGYVLNTNSNFEKTMGYAAEQIRGIHHREFCPNAFYLQYPDFWERLSRGEFMQGKFERIDARGNTIWLEATYNPIRDDQGHIIKVVKFATDITRSIQASEAAKVTVNTAQTSSIQTEKIAQSGLTQLKQILVDSEQATQTLNEAQRLIAALNQQADQINKITASIAQISNQTNLLSLNAAVEAARAGEQGRGFAVVANEVRRLAKGSSEAVEEITHVLKENNALVERTTHAMQKVVEQGKSSQSSVGEIEINVNEILTGARNVSTSIDQLALASTR